MNPLATYPVDSTKNLIRTQEAHEICTTNNTICILLLELTKWQSTFYMEYNKRAVGKLIVKNYIQWFKNVNDVIQELKLQYPGEPCLLKNYLWVGISKYRYLQLRLDDQLLGDICLNMFKYCWEIMNLISKKLSQIDPVKV